MYVIGLTGGIGSGKSAVSERFEKLGIAVVDADVVAREVVEPGKPALSTIADHFGENILTPEGALDRPQLRQKVFANLDEKKWLEELLHPLIFEEIINQISNSTSDYSILVSPLLFETGQSSLCDRNIVVDVPEEIQLERTMKRDNNSEEQVKAIMAAQASREQRLEQADDVIINDASLEKLDTEVEQLHKKYLALAKEKNNESTE